MSEQLVRDGYLRGLLAPLNADSKQCIKFLIRNWTLLPSSGLPHLFGLMSHLAMLTKVNNSLCFWNLTGISLDP